jgi:phosphatidylglycerol:prolipoprotein diacylglycerol transferase|tara:strand:+ start:894 stop:1652 length:759 start_codon:yes stop_codon:yes gene_type:complete
LIEYIEIDGFGSISLYNLLIGIGVIFGLLLFENNNKKLPERVKFKLYNILFLSFIFGFLGARISDLFFFSKAISINNLIYGSSTFMGGLMFAVIFSFISTTFARINFFYVINIFIPFIIISHVFGRLGCFFAGCCYGAETTNNFFLGVKFPVDSIPYFHYGDVIPIHPTQLYESFGLIIILFLTKNKKNKITPYLMYYGILRFIIEFYRNDPRGGLLFDFFSPSQFLSILFICLGLFVKWKYGRSTTRTTFL